MNSIEKELVNIVLKGKKLFSKKQLTYKFYLDPYQDEEITKKFERFTQIYGRKNIIADEKIYLVEQISNNFNLKKIILPNLETLINYLIQENKYQGTYKINQIKINSNLYLDHKFISLICSNKFTINKLITIYEFLEEQLWKFIADLYINKEFKDFFFCVRNKKILDDFYENENNRELKNDMLTLLLIKFVCRTLPNEPKESQSRNLFAMIKEKNMNLPKPILEELDEMKNYIGPTLKYVIEITLYFVWRKKQSLLLSPGQKDEDKNDRINLNESYDENDDEYF